MSRKGKDLGDHNATLPLEGELNDLFALSKIILHVLNNRRISIESEIFS